MKGTYLYAHNSLIHKQLFDNNHYMQMVIVKAIVNLIKSVTHIDDYSSYSH